MTPLWTWILLASAAAFLTKVAGYLLPRRILDRPAVLDLAAAMTVGLLTALVVVTTFASGTELRVDARVPALVAAVLALTARLPFLVVVVLGALVAAGARLAGLG